MPETSQRLIRLPHLLFKLGFIADPEDKKAARRRASTFYRRYRHNPRAPKPIGLPDGQLAWWEHEWDEFLEGCGYTKSPKDNLDPLPSHWLHVPKIQHDP